VLLVLPERCARPVCRGEAQQLPAGARRGLPGVGGVAWRSWASVRNNTTSAAYSRSPLSLSELSAAGPLWRGSEGFSSPLLEPQEMKGMARELLHCSYLRVPCPLIALGDTSVRFGPTKAAAALPYNLREPPRSDSPPYPCGLHTACHSLYRGGTIFSGICLEAIGADVSQSNKKVDLTNLLVINYEIAVPSTML